MIDHDRLFKELISTFFLEFLELFFPQVIAYLEPESLKFLDKEVFTDVTAGEQYEADLVAQIRFREQDTFFLVHIENQSYPQADFGRRMFRYFARLFENTQYLYIQLSFFPTTPHAHPKQIFTVWNFPTKPLWNLIMEWFNSIN